MDAFDQCMTREERRAFAAAWQARGAFDERRCERLRLILSALGVDRWKVHMSYGKIMFQTDLDGGSWTLLDDLRAALADPAPMPDGGTR